MGWQELDTKPPLAYDEDESAKDIPEDLKKSEEAKLRAEILSGRSEPENITPTPTVIVFDSSKDNK